MDAHARNALIGFLLLALFGGLMFALASWTSNSRVLALSEEDDQPPADDGEAASVESASDRYSAD